MKKFFLFLLFVSMPAMGAATRAVLQVVLNQCDPGNEFSRDINDKKSLSRAIEFVKNKNNRDTFPNNALRLLRAFQGAKEKREQKKASLGQVPEKKKPKSKKGAIRNLSHEKERQPESSNSVVQDLATLNAVSNNASVPASALQELEQRIELKLKELNDRLTQVAQVTYTTNLELRGTVSQLQETVYSNILEIGDNNTKITGLEQTVSQQQAALGDSNTKVIDLSNRVAHLEYSFFHEGEQESGSSNDDTTEDED